MLALHVSAQEEPVADVSEDVAIDEEEEVVSEEAEIDADGSASGEAPKLSPEQQRMQMMLQRQMMRYVDERASCADELRALVSLPREEQQRRQAAGTLKLSEECNTEVNTLAAEFQAKLQAGEIQPDFSGMEDGNGDEYDENADEQPAQQAPAPADERSSLPIVATVLLIMLGLIGGAGLFAKKRYEAWQAWVAADETRKKRVEKKLKGKATGPVPE